VIDRVLYDWGYLVAAAVGLTFAADWTLTHAGAKAAALVKDRLSFEGSYELNPTWQAEVDGGRRFSWRAVGVGALLIFAVAWGRLLVAIAGFPPAVFAAGLGMVMLVQAPILMQHAANLGAFRALLDPSAVQGGLRHSRWFVYEQAAWTFVRYAALWFALWVPSQQAFFLGGVASCLLVALRFRRYGRAARAPGAATAPSAGKSSA
jgi:hypothetical protein